MTDKPKNPAAVALGKLAAGKPKRYSPEEIERRRERMAKVGRGRRKLNKTKGKENE